MTAATPFRDPLPAGAGPAAAPAASPASGARLPPHPLPLLVRGVLAVDGVPAAPPEVRAARPGGPDHRTSPLACGSRWLVEPEPREDVVVTLGGAGTLFRLGGLSGAVDRASGGAVTGWARDDRQPGRDVVVVALGAGGVVAAAPARAAEGGRFVLALPAAVSRSRRRQALTLGVAGSGFVLDNGTVWAGGSAAPAPCGPALLPRPVAAGAMTVAIKISAPGLREAPMWGDWHFARALAAAFGRIGIAARVDPVDAWDGPLAREDVAIVLRGRQGPRLDRGRINLMWLISHPERIEDEEFAAYDHVAVASGPFAAALVRRGLSDTGVLHQATDAGLFGRAPAAERRRACLFVGNSRREYRTMVRWCLHHRLPLELHGGGWEGMLPPGTLRSPGIANADLPGVYAAHLLLLNDHWETMRDNGFLSNRLFDGAAAGVPILSDPVAGLAEVFGDTIRTAAEDRSFAAEVRDCLENPAPWLERAARARQIVLAAHTFDHRAATLAALIERIASRKGM